MGNSSRVAVEKAITRHLDAGNRHAAVEAGVAAYGAEVRAYLAKRLRSEAAAREVYSTFCHGVVKDIGAFRRGSSFRTWAYQVARHAAANYLRDRSAERLASLSATAVDQIRDEGWSATSPRRVRDETSPWLKTVVKTRFAGLRKRLSKDELKLLKLRLVDELPWKEVTGRMEPAKEADLRQRFHRLKSKLRRLASEDGLLGDAPQLAPGTLLDGRLRVVRKLGEGSMGEVYLVEHAAHGGTEALKLLHPAVARNPAWAGRFRREARALSRVRHPGIVAVHDFGQLPGGRSFLTLEHVEGERLDEVLRRTGALPVTRALAILRQLADAVCHAHAHGVVHRDLKPANLILGPGDALKVLDFGVAKIVAPGHHDSVVTTAKGDVIGTPFYMAPEQFRGAGTDARVDLYAIGCIAFEMLTRRPPFAGATLHAIMDAHAGQAPERPSRLRPDAGIPAALDAIVLACLEKDPVRRPQAADLLEDLDALRHIPA